MNPMNLNMKRQLTIVGLSLLSSLFSLHALAQSDTLTVRVKGMRCEECAHKIRVELRKDAGVGDINFNLERRTVTVVYNPAQTTSDAINSRLKDTKRYAPSPYSSTDIIKRGFGLRMDDMACSACADRIVERLSQLEGVDSLSPHLDKRYLFIRYDANRTCKAELRQALLDLGFTPVNYYTGNKVAFAYYAIPAESDPQQVIDNVLMIEPTDDANVNPNRRSLGVTYFCEEITAEKLLSEIRAAGIKATPVEGSCNCSTK